MSSSNATTISTTITIPILLPQQPLNMPIHLQYLPRTSGSISLAPPNPPYTLLSLTKTLKRLRHTAISVLG